MSFSGYANQKEASDKKIIRNLFEPNQDAFNTGKKQITSSNLFDQSSVIILKLTMLDWLVLIRTKPVLSLTI
jgi:hypothetical protein